MVYLAISRGIKLSGKIVYVTATAPYLFLAFLLIRGITLPGSSIGLNYLFVPDWSKLGSVKIWKDSLVQIMYSSGVGFGPLQFYGSCKVKSTKIIKPSIIIMVVNSLSSVYAAVVLFTFLGYVSQSMNVKIKDIS